MNEVLPRGGKIDSSFLLFFCLQSPLYRSAMIRVSSRSNRVAVPGFRREGIELDGAV